jgi:hypothetical protein
MPEKSPAVLSQSAWTSNCDVSPIFSPVLELATALSVSGVNLPGHGDEFERRRGDAD